MRKIVILTMVLTLLLTACGGNTGTSDGESESKISISKSKEIDGTWIDKSTEEDMDDETIVIDGDNAVLELWTGMVYKGTVGRNAKTITFTNAKSDGSSIVCNYEVIGDKFVLESDEIATRSFDRVTE